MAGAMNEKDLLGNRKALKYEVLSMGGLRVGSQLFEQSSLADRYLSRAIEQLRYTSLPETIGKARFIPHKAIIGR